jgi:hypothetical protein
MKVFIETEAMDIISRKSADKEVTLQAHLRPGGV